MSDGKTSYLASIFLNNESLHITSLNYNLEPKLHGSWAEIGDTSYVFSHLNDSRNVSYKTY
jgi:hypothetical protein